MTALTRTGALTASTPATVDVDAADPNIITNHRLVQITNTTGGGTINAVWARGTVADPPVGTATDGAWRTNLHPIGDTSGSSVTFTIPNVAIQIKLVSGNTPRYSVTVYDDLT